MRLGGLTGSRREVVVTGRQRSHARATQQVVDSVRAA
jgi:hypothetical protein